MKSAQHEPEARTSRLPGTRRAGIIATVSAVVCATSMFTIPAASAAVPTFPDNLLVFPNRDFVTVEGYQSHKGETATVEVTRAGVGVIGSAKGVVSGGDVAFEVNHPGGYCWGAGTGLNVTPDIQPGDTVSLKFGATAAGDTRVLDTYVTADSILSGSTVTVKGHVGTGVNRAQMEQRIIEPALTATTIARRDIRAVPGLLTAAPKGGYSSSLEFDVDGPNTFTATYVFDDPANAEIAANAGLGERAMAWELEDAAANRQGVTIAEFGEPGGPGMGGCPNGPLQSGPPGPTSVSAAKVSGGLKLTWTPAVAIPGTPAITGYRATAVAQTVTANEQVEIGKRITGQAASGTTITGLAAGENYDVYVVAESSTGDTFPGVHAIPQTDTTAPTVTATPSGGTFSTAQNVTLTASEAGSSIFFTTNGTEPVLPGGVTSDAATLYTGPVNIAQTGTLKFAAIDPSGNVSQAGTLNFSITNDPVPAAPAFSGAPVVGQGTASLTWTAPDAGAPGLTITGYTIQAYTADGTAFGAPKTAPGTATSLVYDGLAGDTAYQFTIRASNINGTSPESAKTASATAQGAVVAIAGPDQSVARRTTATTVALDGTGSTTTGAKYEWEQVLSGATDPNQVTITGGTTLKPTFSLPVFKSPMTNSPLTFRLTVTVGTTVRTDEVTVTPVADTVTIGIAQWRAGDLRISGTSSVVGGVITIHSGSPTGPVLGQVAVTAAAAPATGGDYNLRLRNAAAGASNPGRVWIESTVGGTAGPATVVNR
ncbi:hypothetical protein SRABI83_01801 [Arthrobacter sp. Bi83]|uniref:fibronectin type III domain-containing protein n=1 Tax=Arthrobacter sp. Bi83 TaxID=2822353 RepID=UPI001DA5A327|nr:fibronectin type III domain-containing protein [Arthrobacter sp. Bi83]CAH0196654.1 hypothetical protein SRABI83_01801 [Arthrobacter sp. Bi83]